MKPLKPHPLFPTLAATLGHGRKLLHAWAGIVFRSVELEFARSSKLLDGKGSRKHGARWTAPGAFRSVSLGLDAQGAEHEALQRATYYGWRGELLKPRLRVAVTVNLHRVLDFTSDASAGRMGVTLRELLGEDWRKVNDAGKESLSQALARAAHAAGAEGMLVPSAAVGGASNLVIFVGNVLPESVVQIENQAELDRWLKKR